MHRRIAKPKQSEPEKPTERLTHRVACRMTADDYDKLAELRLALHQANDGRTVRALIRLHHAHMHKAQLRVARQARRDAEALETNPKQVKLFGGR